MKAYLVLFLLLLFSASPLLSQRVLVLDLTGMKTKRIRYNSGDYISIRVKDDKTIYKGFLEVVSDTSFFISGNHVILDSLESIIKYNKAPKAISKQAFLVGGITALVVGINNGVTKGSVFPDDDSYIVPASFLGLGAIFTPFWRKTYRISKKNCTVKILDMTPVPPVDDSP